LRRITILRRVAPSAPVQQHQTERESHQSVDGIPVFDVEKGAPLTEHPRFEILFDTQALIQMASTHPCGQTIITVRIERRTRYFSGGLFMVASWALSLV